MDIRERNQAIWRFLILPLIFLTVSLLGGLRVGAERQNFIFIAPPLVCLILALLLMLLFVRGKLVVFAEWLSHDFPFLTNAANVLTLVALFAASAQAFNSVIPERGFLFWLFSFFFLWTLWNNLFSEFDAKRLLRSLAVLFGTAFLLKHLILAAFAAPEESTLWKIANLVFEGVPRSLFDVPNFAPMTGYISFFTMCLYIAGLVGLGTVIDLEPKKEERPALPPETSEQLTPAERQLVREFLDRKQLEKEAVEAIIEDQ